MASKVVKYGFYFVILLVLLGIGAFVYIYTTPYYCMIKLGEAFEKSNIDEFQYYCDTDSLSESIIDEIALMPVELLPNDIVSPLKMLQSNHFQNDFFRILLAKAVKNQLLKLIKEKRQSKNFVVTKLSTIESVSYDDNHAVIKIDLQKEDKTFPFHLRFRKLDGRWKLVGFEKLSDILKAAIDPKRGKE